jgi:alpha-galactosidase
MTSRTKAPRRALPKSTVVAALFCATIGGGGAAYAQTTIAISMTAAPATPRLQGPFIVGARPSTPLVFAIPATGQATLAFSATGVPAGLTLAAGTGIISGTAPAAGSYAIAVTATNSAGSATATYTIVSGNTIALTPPMGWNSYDSFGASVTEQEMIDEGTAIRQYLQPYGWNTVVIDYRWYENGQPIDANGRYLPVTSKYPSATGSNGFKPLADKIHAMGLNFGIHIMRGIPRKSFDANSPIANSTYTAKDAGDSSDACPWDTHMWGVRGATAAGQAWYDALFAQYASWGIDFIKIDDMLNNTTKVYHQAEVDAIRKAIDKSGRAILLSLSPGPDDPAWLPNSSSHLNSNANMWRIVNDFWDTGDGPLCDLNCAFTAIRTWGGVNGLTPGHWADADMLPLGYLGPRKEWSGGNHQTNFTKNEQVTVMSLWTMLPSPLILGGNPMRLNTDAWTLALLTNEEVLAVNQDVLGARGKRTASGSNEFWVRDLSGGRKAVAFFNRGAQDAMMSATFAQIGVTGTPTIRDLWHRADVTGMTTGISVSVPGGGALMYTVSPAGAGGTGGAGGGTSGAAGASGSTGGRGGSTGGGGAGAGGRTASGGSTGAAGMSATGGISGSAGAGTTGTGGSSSATGGSGASGSTGGSGTIATGGSVGSGGMTATGSGGALAGTGGTMPGGGNTGGRGAAGASGAGGSAGGCGCFVAGGDTHVPTVGSLLIALALFSRRRRQRR